MAPSLYQVTKGLLQAFGRYPRKNLGQHFLVDPKVVERIIRAAELTKNDFVIEIGSGLGVVSAELAGKVYHLTAIEIDKELLGISREVLKGFGNVSYVGRDILKVDLKEISLGRKYKIIGNLPYYITAPIVEKILTARDKPELAVIMVQKEVAERMAAKPGSKKYGSFSIFTQYHARVELNSFVSKSSFLPWPEVGSAIVSLMPHTTPLFPRLDEKRFFDIVHAAFQQRRKKIRNSLADYFGNRDACPDFHIGVQSQVSGLNLNRRPEELSLEEFAALANCCYNSQS